MLSLLAFKKDESSLGDMSKFGTFGGAIFLILGILAFIGFLVTGAVVDYIDSELEANCDSTSGQIGQVTGIDEGQCQDGRNTREMVISLQTPLLIFGGLMSMSGGLIIFKS